MTTYQEDIFDTIEDAVADIAAGKLVIVTDDENRENEGDLIMAASKATPEAVNMMIRYGSGIVCVPTTETQLLRLGLNPMVQQNREVHRTDFTVSVDAAQGITTGISACDRTEAIRIVANPEATPDQLVQPGHVFPLKARPGGVLERAGHTEAAVDLAQLAGLPPSGVICELMNDDGSVMRLPELLKFRDDHGLKIISIASLIAYRHRKDRLIECLAKQPFHCEHGVFDMHVYQGKLDGRLHFALSLGELQRTPTLVRVQSSQVLTDVFGETSSKSRTALVDSLVRIRQEGTGVLLYICPANSGLDLDALVKGAPEALSKTATMDLRDYGVGAQILADLGLAQIRLLTQSPRNVIALDGYGLEIVEQISLSTD